MSFLSLFDNPKRQRQRPERRRRQPMIYSTVKVRQKKRQQTIQESAMEENEDPLKVSEQQVMKRSKST